MKLCSGDTTTPITLPAIDGGSFDTKALEGQRFMISFFRFASCPFCNLRIDELVSRFDEFEEGFTIVAVFDSPLDNLREYTEGHFAPFPILADSENRYYHRYGIEYSLTGMFKGMILRTPTLMKGILKGYFPLKIKGRLTTMPADFLVDEQGVIQTAYYGRDEGDHLPFESVLQFSKSRTVVD